MSSLPENNPPRYVASYTTALFLVGLLALAMIFSHQMLIRILQPRHHREVVIIALRFVQAIEMIVCICAFLLAYLRAKRSPIAATLTPAASIFLALWLPIGTIVFLWWLLSIRPRERALVPA
jgi:hypothetical protein